jgi:DNA invertase Pin-like site-specific DNA recombinase
MDENKRAWTYSRIDAPEDAHGRLKEQKKELFDYAEQMGFEVVGSSEDLGSGLDFERSGLLKVMKAAADGEFGVLLIKRLDRLGRDMPKTMELLMEMDQLGIKVYSPLEGEISFSQYKDVFDRYISVTLE